MPLLPQVAIDSLHKMQNEAQNQNAEETEIELFPASEISQFIPDSSGEFVYRPLRLSDFNRGYLELLSDLTTVGHVSKEAFRARFETMTVKPQAYFIVVVEDTKTGKVVGSISLVLEWKFIHEAAVRGRIEDVVVHHDYRSKGLARVLNEIAIQLAKKQDVYKLSLDCKDQMISFYEKFGYKKDVNFMMQRFKE
ncbi:hypothetical protein M3Y94_01176200 [Aphelenchoides besseyi]|nr:hypothetical protein M3Y94_01176200 [Aphelenchoides besseyi]